MRVSACADLAVCLGATSRALVRRGLVSDRALWGEGEGVAVGSPGSGWGTTSWRESNSPWPNLL